MSIDIQSANSKCEIHGEGIFSQIFTQYYLLALSNFHTGKCTGTWDCQTFIQEGVHEFAIG